MFTTALFITAQNYIQPKFHQQKNGYSSIVIQWNITIIKRKDILIHATSSGTGKATPSKVKEIRIDASGGDDGDWEGCVRTA